MFTETRAPGPPLHGVQIRSLYTAVAAPRDF